MVVLTIPTTIQNVDKIFHIGDIHIRNHIRHGEYRMVFSELAKQISSRATENSIIYVAGDIVHSKSEISPELIEMLSLFFRTLTKLCPTFVILGNHDTNLNNINRLDTLSPIVELLDSPNLYFLKRNGYYTFAQIGFNVLEVSTQPADFLDASGLNTPVKIALHHGAVDLALTDLNARIGNKEVTLNTFNGHDLALLGDIHLRQFLQERHERDGVLFPTIAYCGSLIQQNHGEKISNHGMLVWNLADFTVEPVNIYNEYGYYTLEIKEGNIQNWDESLIPPRPRLRVKFQDTNSTDQKIVETFIRSKRKVAEWAPSFVKTQNKSAYSLDKTLNFNIRDAEFQNTLIERFFEEQKISESTLDLIRHLNRITNSKLGTTHKSDTLRNVTWEPVTFKFSNMFSYGKDNFIDFTDLNGIYGVFGPNKIGKSTLFDSICFCLFDKCSKTNKAKDVLNKSEKSFECEFKFRINDLLYTVYKYGTVTRTGNVKVDIDFTVTNKNGVVTSLNGDQRDSTTKTIRNYVGSYEDFTLTALSVQNNGTNFIEKPQRERRELLVNFLDIGVFEELYTIASEALNESNLKWKVKSYENENYSEKITTAALKLEQLTTTKAEVDSNVAIKKTQIYDLEQERNKLVASIVPVNATLNIKTLSEKITVLEGKIEKLTDIIVKDNVQISELVQTCAETFIEESRIQEAIKLRDEYKAASVKHAQAINALHALELKEKHYLNISNDYHSHEYDPDCKYCVQASIVQQGRAATVEVANIAVEIAEVKSMIKNLEDKYPAHGTMEVEKELSKLNSSKARYLEASNSMDLKEREVSLHQKELILLQQELAQTVELLTEAAEYTERQENNSKIRNELQKLDINLTELREELDSLTVMCANTESQITVQNQYIEDYAAKLHELTEIRSEYEAYMLYLQAIKTDGIPYRLTNDILPGIEEEVNLLLTGVVDFRILLETDNKNINAYIMYEEGRTWPVESGSGMEKFVSSLAIRNALIVNTSLPKPNIVCIDEGFGTLDDENLASINILFQKMKENFKTLFCISHIGSVKDIVDHPIYVVKKEDSSFIYAQ